MINFAVEILLNKIKRILSKVVNELAATPFISTILFTTTDLFNVIRNRNLSIMNDSDDNSRNRNQSKN